MNVLFTGRFQAFPVILYMVRFRFLNPIDGLVGLVTPSNIDIFNDSGYHGYIYRAGVTIY